MMIRIGHLSTAYHTSFILIQDKIFSSNFEGGISWKLFGTGPEMIRAFEKGELDGGYLGLPPGIIGIDKDVPILCVAGGHVEGTIMIAANPFKDFYESSNSIKKVLKQFKGKSLGVTSKGSIHDVILKYHLHQNHLVDQINVKNYNQAEFIAVDLMKGIINGGVGTPALLSFSNSLSNSNIIIPPQVFWPYNPSYGLFFRKKMIKERPDVVVEFLQGHKDACKLMRENSQTAAEIISKSFKIIPPTYFSEIIKISPKYCIALSKEYVKSTMLFVKELKKLGYISRDIKKEEIFFEKLVKSIHPESDHYKNEDLD